MNNTVWIWVGIGGSIGSMCRYGIARLAGDRFEGIFPYGTLISNATGAFLLGILQGSDIGPVWLLFLGTGILGGLTTFSTWMLESVRLLEERENITALLNVLGSITIGLLLFGLGYSLAGGQ